MLDILVSSEATVHFFSICNRVKLKHFKKFEDTTEALAGRSDSNLMRSNRLSHDRLSFLQIAAPHKILLASLGDIGFMPLQVTTFG